MRPLIHSFLNTVDYSKSLYGNATNQNKSFLTVLSATLPKSLSYEIDPNLMLLGLGITAFLFHLLAMTWMLEIKNTKQPEPPLKIMEVALVALAPPQAEVAPPAPPKPVAPPKPEVKKPPVKKVVEKKKEPLLKKIERTPPEPEVSEAPSPPVITPAPVKTEPPAVSAPVVSKPAPVSPKPEVADRASVSGVVPLSRVKPVYPLSAKRRGITSGWVEIELTITPTGSVANARVVKSEPEGIFDDAALDAIRQWQFKPKAINGQAVMQHATQKINFMLK